MDENHKAIDGKNGVFAIMTTDKGDIVLELYYKDTPLTVTNFVGLAEGTLDAAGGKPYYDGLTFHRVIADFMIQGGDPAGNGTGGPGYTFPDEIVDSYKFTGAGILAMANAGSGSDGLGTNGSQFFITHVKTDWLNGKHTIFGKVIKGQDVVNATEQGDHIKHIEIVRQGADAEKFTATQADFDKLRSAAIEANKDAADKERAAYEAAVAEAKAYYAEIAKLVKYEITEEGSGEKIGLPRRVSVDYTGWLEDGTQFDTSKGRGELEFITGAGQMITGFDAMVQDMKLGETRKITLPPETAYGSQGAGGVIPPNATIIFEVTVVSVQ